MRKPKFKKSLIILLGLTFFQSTALAEDESYTLPPKHSESFPQRLWNEPKQTISQLAYSSAEAIVYGWPKSLTTLVGAIGAAAAWKSYQTGAGWSGPVGAGLLGGAGGFAVAEVADKFTPEPVRQATIEVLTDSKQMFSQAKKSLVNYLSSGSDNPREPARQIVVTDPVLSEQLQKQKEAIELLEREFQLSEQRNKDTIDELQRQLEASKADSALNLGGGHGGREPPHPVVLSLADQVEKNTASIGKLQHQIHHNDKKATRGIAAMAALGNVASPSAPGKTVVGAGIGSYHGIQAVAFNISHRPKNFGNTIFQAGIGTSSGGKPVIRAGVSYEF